MLPLKSKSATDEQTQPHALPSRSHSRASHPIHKAARLAPDDQAKPIRFALKSLRIKQKEAMAARRRLWGGMFKGRGGSTPAPGRRQVEEAAARARGVDPGRGGGDDDILKRGDGWLYVSIAVGVVAFAVAGFAAAKFTQG